MYRREVGQAKPVRWRRVCRHKARQARPTRPQQKISAQSGNEGKIFKCIWRSSSYLADTNGLILSGRALISDLRAVRASGRRAGWALLEMSRSQRQRWRNARLIAHCCRSVLRHVPASGPLHPPVCYCNTRVLTAQSGSTGSRISGRLCDCAGTVVRASRNPSGENQDPEIANPPGRAGCISAESREFS